ncbi:MAG TPA: methyltransferase domain-containing protein [Chloroflexota bacterium]|nr:methyltransferase domain-containing protein [Chloroflexota bacterium]
MRSDVNFDGVASQFEAAIYGSSRGTVRLSVLWEDLLSEIPQIQAGGLSILDAGGGAGHVAVRLAQCGNTVVLADASREMLDVAAAAAREAGVSGRLTIVHAAIQELDAAVLGTFDVITCHAVVEWLADPREAIASLARLLKPDGVLSLMFHNRDAALLARVLRGNVAAALDEQRHGYQPRGWKEGMVPLAEADVREWMAAAGLTVLSKAGIRIIHDHLPEEARSGAKLNDLIALETALRKQEPFASLGYHIHLVCTRSARAT